MGGPLRVTWGLPKVAWSSGSTAKAAVQFVKRRDEV